MPTFQVIHAVARASLLIDTVHVANQIRKRGPHLTCRKARRTPSLLETPHVKVDPDQPQASIPVHTGQTNYPISCPSPFPPEETALDMASALGRILVLPGFFKFPHPNAYDPRKETSPVVAGVGAPFLSPGATS